MNKILTLNFLKSSSLLMCLFNVFLTSGQSSINEQSVLTKNGLIYLKNELYSGEVFSFFNNNQVKSKYFVSNGLISGAYEEYYKDGNYSKIDFQDTALITSIKIQIEIKKNEKLKIETDSIQQSMQLIDFLNYKIGGDKKLLKLESKNYDGKLKEKDKIVFDEYRKLENSLNSLTLSKNQIIKDINSMGELVNRELKKSQFVPNKIFYYEVDKSLKNGIFMKYAESGTKIEEGQYVNGKQDGLWIYHYPSGKIKATGKYAVGDGGNIGSSGVPINGRSGNWIFYHENGKMNVNFNFSNGILNGKYMYFAESGTKTEEGQYVNGKQNDLWIYNYPSGKLKATGKFLDGDGGNISEISGVPMNGRSGNWIFYHENGKIRGNYNFSNGKLNGVAKDYFENGILSAEVNYKNDYFDGVKKDYFENGKIHNIEIYKEGKKNGLCKSYHENGKLNEEVEYIADEPNGLIKTYFSNGQLQLNSRTNPKSLADGHFVGDAFLYKEDGTLSIHIKYQLDGTYVDMLTKTNQNANSNQSHKCDWCGKTYSGTNWSIGPRVYGSCSNRVAIDSYFLIGYCSKKCAVDDCNSKN